MNAQKQIADRKIILGVPPHWLPPFKELMDFLLLIFMAGWSPKNVGRILGILHETWYGGNILKAEERTGRFYTTQSKQSYVLVLLSV